MSDFGNIISLIVLGGIIAIVIGSAIYLRHRLNDIDGFIGIFTARREEESDP